MKDTSNNDSIFNKIKFGEQKIAILISGTGSIMQAILEYFIAQEAFCGDSFVVISNTPNASGLEKAQKLNVNTFVIESKNKTRTNFELEIEQILIQNKAQLIVLAGFMRILTPNFVKKYEGKILNTHPSLLPSFKGAHAVRDALAAKTKITGTTVHYVNHELDGGQIIAQEQVQILQDDTEETLHEKIKQTERKLYPRVIRQLLLETDT